MGNVRYPEMLTFPLFDHASITGEKSELKTIAIADVAANYSSEFRFDTFIQNSQGILGLVMEFDGSASDTVTVTVQFNYGARTTWGVKSLTVIDGVNANTNQFERLDILSGWRDYIPFEKMRFVITKTGANAALPIIARLTRM